MQKKIGGKSRRRMVEVRGAEQFEALSSPVRDQVLQVVVNQAGGGRGTGGVTIREIAEQLGRKPASLYRHIEGLVGSGLIREVGPTASGGRDATAYAADGEVVVLVTPERSGAAMDGLCRYLEKMGVHAGRETAEATRAGLGGKGGEVGTMSMFGWLDESQRGRLRDLLHEVAQVFDEAERRPGTRLVAASMLVRPVMLPDGEVADAS
jgi:predicted transcriptional regulator